MSYACTKCAWICTVHNNKVTDVFCCIHNELSGIYCKVCCCFGGISYPITSCINCGIKAMFCYVCTKDGTAHGRTTKANNGRGASGNLTSRAPATTTSFGGSWSVYGGDRSFRGHWHKHRLSRFRRSRNIDRDERAF